MICERCGEIGETFITEKHGELCEACQRLIEQQQQRSPIRRLPPEEEQG
jgi:hypothetical protein